MIAPDSELIAILHEMNPWWRGERVADLPAWRRAAFAELDLWLRQPPAPRAVLLSGARQIGKTTLFLQAIEALVAGGGPSRNVLYVTFDHPLLKLAGLEAVLRLWRSTELREPGLEYIFVDEIQFLPHWQTWVKHQVDFQKERRIALTGSATPLATAKPTNGDTARSRTSSTTTTGTPPCSAALVWTISTSPTNATAPNSPSPISRTPG